MDTTIFGKTCVCIARVSTSQQDLTAQTNALHRAASEMGLTVINTIETKESGFKSYDQKEGFHELVNYLTMNNCKIVICTELSRLARKKFLLEKIKQWFIDNQIQLYIMDLRFSLFDDSMNVSMTTDIVFSVHASIAENEMKNKKARLKRGRDELVKEGYSISGKVTYGYIRRKSAVKIHGKERSVMEIDPKAAEEIKMIYDWYLHGIDNDITRCSLSKINEECIARGFGHYLHSKRNVNKALTNQAYTGHIITHNIQKNPEYWSYGNVNEPKYLPSSSEMRYPAIISQSTYDAVQKKMKSATTCQNDKSTKHFTLLSRLIKCVKCGYYYLGDYRIKKGGFQSYTYRCQNHKSHGAPSVSMKILDAAIWNFCRLHYWKFIEYVKTFPAMHQADEIKKRIANIQEKQSTIVQQQEELVKRYLSVQSLVGSNVGEDVFTSQIDGFRKELQKLDSMIHTEEEKLNSVEAAEEMAQKSTIQYIESNKSEMRRYINILIKEIHIVYSDSIYRVIHVQMHNDNLAYYTCDPDVSNNYEFPINRYIIINRRNTLAPQIKYICAPCIFDPDTMQFGLYDSGVATLANVFGDVDEVFFKSMDYKPLEIYGDDKPNGGVVVAKTQG